MFFFIFTILFLQRNLCECGLCNLFSTAANVKFCLLINKGNRCLGTLVIVAYTSCAHAFCWESFGMFKLLDRALQVKLY